MNISQDIAQTAKNCASIIANTPTEQKNAVLLKMAQLLDTHRGDIVAANQTDLTAAKKNNLPSNLVARLQWSDAKINSSIAALHKIANLPDPVGQLFEPISSSNGLKACRMRVPLGVIMMIYEARPHVTVNAGSFCLKSGNAVILRGGSEAKTCNQKLGELWQTALADVGLSIQAIQVISGSHEQINELLQLNSFIDLVIPRGGPKLIETVSKKSQIPVLKHYNGICHVYIDEAADLHQGLEIALDSKCLMPSVCNAMETLLIHSSFESHLNTIIKAFQDNGVEVKGCERIRNAVSGIEAATEQDWTTEYLDMKVSMRMVDSVDEAISHINQFGSHHTDAIVTDSQTRAEQFVNLVDSAVVLVNASTMFCDGDTLGMGAEIGIATGKFHARGPMGLQELTSYKFVVRGSGQTMGGDFLPSAATTAPDKV
ncbi:glutamate-5-semialdehyde dehydrogenase [Rivularia sp. PCC 7116]|uniref:glutamate-5-semialdehyde dehydrogenase n=1 Tax=Rivularia sp. PCC 7116 TaxID=373994 RepID=UPI00029F36E8|nr:glutamate-5-semialdehyde dehydrogenase [Rivularia sp. PCC 7116]AFY55319.1 glutamate-5-semialdehyde dehydrogenase [Rivularia sp. PCC 7116]